MINTKKVLERCLGHKNMLGDYDICKKCGKRGIYDKNMICDECKKEVKR